MIIEDEFLSHYGTPRKSGRYPWGSGGNESSRNRDFLGMVDHLRAQGLSDTEIAIGMGMSTTQWRAQKSIEINKRKQSQISQAQRLKETGMSNVAIGKEMSINESSVRSLLTPGTKDKNDILTSTSNMLRHAVEEKGMIDIGVGVEHYVGVARHRFNTAVAILENEGYKKHYVKMEQLGTGFMTTIQVLTKGDVPYSEVYKNRFDIKQITDMSDDGGRSFTKIKPPTSIDSSRISVRYAEQGGNKADGVIYVRPGVDDISLGSSRYAQVRVAVDGTHYLKGMAVYKDDLPKGTDLEFNTSKSNTGNKLDAMKKLGEDPAHPFTSTIGRQHGVMNIVNEEGAWETWSRNLSSQMLSKQSPALAKSQLEMSSERRKSELAEINSLTNPAVRKKLLEAYAEGADAAAVHLKVNALPRSSMHVLLPVPKMKETEVYAPNFNNGERVVLIRHPHGGVFEIPELVVNNKNPSARALLGQARDAIGIHPKVAEKLSGADFDGDAVLVIPNNSGKVHTAPSLEGLKKFDPKSAYPKYEGMKVMDARTKQFAMGDISNLITDMTLHGASNEELARAVRHSMVVIDAEKHELNWKESSKVNGITQLKDKYQGSPRAGAATLISKSSSRLDVPERKQGFRVDPATGHKVYTETGATYLNKAGHIVTKTTRSSKMAETTNAHTLSSGTPMEKVYAEYANKLKVYANAARKAAANTKGIPVSKSAKTTYAKEAASLNAKLNVALKNAPLERQAQVIANGVVSQRRASNPELEPSVLKKVKYQTLEEARARVGAKKTQVVITPREWEAIQAGAISNHMVSQILDNTDIDHVRKLATPKTPLLMTTSKTTRAKAMLAQGYTQAEVAGALGVSLTTLKTGIA